MHNFIKSICVVLFCFFVCSCADNKGYEKEISEYETESYVINSENIKFNIDEELSLNSDIKNQTDSWISDFESRVSDNKITGRELPNMQIKHKVYECNDFIISTVCEKYVYINGVHGQIWWAARNFDVKNNCYLTLSDLFYDDEYKKILNSKMEQMLTDEPEKYHDLWEIPSVKNGVDDNFYFDGKNLVIFFQPYELSYYAKGVIEFPIETNELRGFIKEEYLT